MMNLDKHYVNPRITRLYDLDSGWSVDRDYYLSLAGETPLNILDVGCGTGLLCEAYAAKGHHVTGVDPAEQMLSIARRRKTATPIQWCQATAQSFQSKNRYDLIIMTGHVFQVLLTEDEALAALQNLKAHLTPNGRIVFESRNPSFNWSKRWDYDVTLQTPEGDVEASRKFLRMDEGLMKFEFHFTFPDEKIITESKIRFWSRREIERFIHESELAIENFCGDWNGGPFYHLSEEMIFQLRAKKAL